MNAGAPPQWRTNREYVPIAIHPDVVVAGVFGGIRSFGFVFLSLRVFIRYLGY